MKQKLALGVETSESQVEKALDSLRVWAMTMTRIGGGAGFWGDRVFAPLELLSTSKLDYLILDYLAEVTMSILAKQKMRDPKKGWATDLVDWLEAGGVELLHDSGAKLVTNAGGANPADCAKMVLELACEVGWTDCRIALITGDDVVQLIDDALDGGSLVENIETGQKLSELEDGVVTANAYLGAGPIGRALESGADIVITGRVADASLIVGCMLHSCGWAAESISQGHAITTPIHRWATSEVESPLDVLASWSIAGHLIECGAQVCGGNSTDWKLIDNLAEVGYPIAEIEEGGSCIITKPEGTGGAVNRRTVAEQLLYEIGDPAAYITPDVVVDLRHTTLTETGENRVRVEGTRGLPPTDHFKVSATHLDGWFACSDLVVCGPDAVERSKACDDVMRARLSDLTRLEINSEFFGAGASLPPGLAHLKVEPSEVLIRWGARSGNRADIIEFGRSVAPLILTGPAGVAGYSARPKPREQLRYFPFLIPRDLVEPQIQIVLMNTLRLRVSDRSPRLGSVFDRLESIANGTPEDQWRRKFARRVLVRLQRPTMRE